MGKMQVLSIILKTNVNSENLEGRGGGKNFQDDAIYLLSRNHKTVRRLPVVDLAFIYESLPIILK